MKKVFFVLFFILLLIFYNRPRLHFISSSIHISLYEDIEPLSYIKNDIDYSFINYTHNVDNQHVGHYMIHYTYRHKNYSLDVYVEDHNPPTYETINKKILINQTVDPSSLVIHLKDDSPTTIYFKENYIFNELKTYKVSIVVEDQYHNKTIKDAYILVEEKDITAPLLSNYEDITILQGDSINLKDVSICDDYDLNPTYTIDDSKLNLYKIGEYDVYYDVKDCFNNTHRYTRKIEVISKYANRKPIKDGEKTCYLTFDDGPSSNTKDILSILKRYDIKATFFVCGLTPKYHHYIKEAYKQGHSIGMHSYSHDYQEIYSSLSAYLKDLNKIKELIYEQTGVYSTILRFPGGSSNMVSKQYNEGLMTRLSKKMIDLGYQYYDWNVINGDGEGIHDVKGLIDQVKEEIKNKEDIMVLMHDSGASVSTVEALPQILNLLIQENYIFKVIEHNSPTFHHSINN